MKRRISLIALLAALVLPLAPAAFAHDPGPRTFVIDTGYNVVYRPYGHYGHHGVPPHWLRTSAPFHRWYHGSRYRHMRQLSWAQLYDLYTLEVRHSRPVRHYHRRGNDYHRDRRHRRHRH